MPLHDLSKEHAARSLHARSIQSRFRRDTGKDLEAEGQEGPIEEPQGGPGDSSRHMERPGGGRAPKAWRPCRDTGKDLEAEEH